MRHRHVEAGCGHALLAAAGLSAVGTVTGPDDLTGGEAPEAPTGEGADTRPARPRRRWLRITLWLVAAVVAAAAVFAGWQALRVYLAWRGVDRVAFDVDAGRANLPERTPQAPGPGEGDPAPAAPAGVAWPDEEFDAFLIIGSDESESTDNIRADAIVVFLQPQDGTSPMLVGVPRSLAISSPCTGEVVRLGVVLEGCGEAVSGPVALAIAVEDFTGIAMDHFAVLRLQDFREIIDSLGGVTICVENPVRLSMERAVLFEAGCTLADGKSALQWVRSRTPLELVDGEWQVIPDSGELARIDRIQDLLLQLLTRLKRYRSFASFGALVEELSDSFVIDDQISLDEAIGYAWELRQVPVASIALLQVPVESTVDAGGEFLMTPTGTFLDLIAGSYPPAAEMSAGTG